MSNPTLQAELEQILANAMITAQVEPWNDGRTSTTALQAILATVSKHLPELVNESGDMLRSYQYKRIGWNEAITEMEKLLGEVK